MLLHTTPEPSRPDEESDNKTGKKEKPGPPPIEAGEKEARDLFKNFDL